MSAVAVKAARPKHETEKGWRQKYQRWFGPLRDAKGKPAAPMPDYMIEQACFMSCMGWNKYGPPTGSPGELVVIPSYNLIKENGDVIVMPEQKVHTGAAHHFMEMTNFFFSDKNGIYYFEWNPWATQMLMDKILHRRYGVTGPASSSKTETGVVWGLMNYLCEPFKTKVLVGSTTKSAAKGKVWGSFTEAWQQVARVMGSIGMPGKLLKSQDKIIYEHNGVQSTKAGIELVAGAASEEAASADKVQGYKRDRVFFIADEFATMSRGLYNTIKGNLFANPLLDFMAMFNADSFYDVAGEFSRPADPRGWESVNVETECYKSVEGFVRHLDGEKSPNANFVSGQEKWRGLVTYDKIEQRARDAGGKTTKEYYQMVRGWWAPAGLRDMIYTEMELVKYFVDHDFDDGFDGWQWDGTPTPVCGFDPAYTHDGDHAAAAFGKCGWVKHTRTMERKRVLQIKEIVFIAENVTTNDEKVFQIVSQLIAECKRRKIDPKHVGVDETGGGIAITPQLAKQWSNDFLRLQFGGRASEMPFSLDNPKKACDVCSNLSTEVWYSGKPLMRTGQFRVGNKPDLIREMCNRSYETKGDKIKIEPKDEVKKKMNGRSPDRADAALICLHVCRQRLGLVSKEKPGKIDRTKPALGFLHQHLQGKFTPSKLNDWGPSLKSSGISWNR